MLLLTLVVFNRLKLIDFYVDMYSSDIIINFVTNQSVCEGMLNSSQFNQKGIPEQYLMYGNVVRFLKVGCADNFSPPTCFYIYIFDED